MKRRLLVLPLLVCFVLALVVGSQPGSAKPRPQPPAGFFGMGPQTPITVQDLNYMDAGGVESIRVPVSWAGIQPTRRGGYNWSGIDGIIAAASARGLRVLPFIYGTPTWLARDWRTLPVDNGRQRAAWRAFLAAAVARYGPGGEFWDQTQTGGVGPNYEPEPPLFVNPIPIRTWQIWNEPNFFYFAYPATPARYAKLVKISGPAIKQVDPSATVLLAGLFGEPTAKGPRGMDADLFLKRIYDTPGLKNHFDAISLHPYAAFTEDLEEMVEGLMEVTLENRDRPRFYITEMGWGSQNNFREVAFEHGIRGQVKQLRSSYGYLLENMRRLNLKGVYWFSWKDLPGSCNFCDSVGLFRAGAKFKPKPAWRAFIALTGGRARP